MLDEVAPSALALAARPATPIFKAPYRLILLFLQGRMRGIRPCPPEVWRRFSAPCLVQSGVSKLQNQLATAAMSLRFTSMLPMTSLGVPPVMSIWVTTPALATELVTVPPAAPVAATFSV